MINRTRTIKPQFIYDLAAKNKQRVVVCDADADAAAASLPNVTPSSSLSGSVSKRHNDQQSCDLLGFQT